MVWSHLFRPSEEAVAVGGRSYGGMVIDVRPAERNWEKLGIRRSWGKEVGSELAARRKNVRAK